jgi:hypothetical protein
MGVYDENPLITIIMLIPPGDFIQGKKSTKPDKT